jgi:hypothetical protein
MLGHPLKVPVHPNLVRCIGIKTQNEGPFLRTTSCGLCGILAIEIIQAEMHIRQAREMPCIFIASTKPS